MHGSLPELQQVGRCRFILRGGSRNRNIPDAHLLFHGELKRSGDSLKILGEDGTTALIQDYFKSERLPDLLSPEGAIIPGDVVFAIAGSQAPGQYAQAGAPAAAAEAIGRVAIAQGNATAVRNGVAVTLNVGDAILKGDVVQTGGGTRRSASPSTTAPPST